MTFRCILLAAFAAVLSGCATPLVRPDPIAFQSKVDHAVDWQNLALRTVEHIPLAMANQSRNVYVALGPEGMLFADVYKKFLEEQLYLHNYPVVHTRSGADIILDFKVDWMLYDKGNNKRLTDYWSLYTTATAVGGQLRNISSTDTGLFAGLVAGPVLDLLTTLNSTTNAEVVVTSTITSPQTNHYHFIRSETVYVQPSDLCFYIDVPPKPDPLPLIPLRVSGGGYPLAGRP